MFPWHQESWQLLSKRYQANNLPHALLITGPAGLGKLGFAKNFAAKLLCQNPTAVACGKCRGCILLQTGNHADYILIEPEESGKQIKIDQIRELITEINQTSQQGGYKVVLIAPADMLNSAAANSLLKSLEEPAPKVIFILVTAKPNLLPATILSRCQKILINRPSFNDAKAFLLQQNLSLADAEFLLAITDNQPLTALELANNKQLAEYQTLMTDLVALFQHEISAAKFVTRYKDWELAVLLKLLQLLLHALLQQRFGKNSWLAEQYLTKFKLYIPTTNLLALDQLLQQYNKHLGAKINLNIQLALENVANEIHYSSEEVKCFTSPVR